MAFAGEAEVAGAFPSLGASVLLKLLPISSSQHATVLDSDIKDTDTSVLPVESDVLDRVERPWRRTMSQTWSSEHAQLTRLGPAAPAEQVVRYLLPSCSATVFTRLRREGVGAAADLACLDKEDLQALGFSMVERCKVLKWAREGLPPPATPSSPLAHVARDPPPSLVPERDDWPPTKVPSAKTLPSSEDSCPVPSDESTEAPMDEVDQRRLDEVEGKADFWCDLVDSAQPAKQQEHADLDVGDVRENMLEKLFDLTEERVKEVYNGIDRDADGRISALELRRGLQRYKLPELSEKDLARIFKLVTASQSRFLQLSEFESVLSRLKLAQLLIEEERAKPSGLARLGDDKRFTVVDFSSAGARKPWCVKRSELREFFFGHRQRQKTPDATLVRWVHLDTDYKLDWTSLLSLTVKYSLHPLSVEDVIEQSPTKIDRNGRNFFVTIENVCLMGADNGSEPVRVCGRHVSIFCAGPPTLDTIITVVQPHQSFAEEWPGGVALVDQMEPDPWVARLQERLQAPLSRLRERLADFLMYQVIDLCTDALRKVMRAYTMRLGHLEAELHQQGAMLDQVEWPAEVTAARLQLAILVRRVRGLQRVSRHILHDPDLSTGLQGYFQDIADHLNEAYDDAHQLSERCSVLVQTYERTLERGQERMQQLTAERLNKTLFVLTAFTTMFAPAQFIAGVYGMNFVDADGMPSIPELKWVHGYRDFWLLIAGYLLVGSIIAVILYRFLERSEAKARGQWLGQACLPQLGGGRRC